VRERDIDRGKEREREKERMVMYDIVRKRVVAIEIRHRLEFEPLQNFDEK